MNTKSVSQQCEQALREEATRILQRHPGVPGDFKAIFAVKADAKAVDLARESTRIGAFDKGLMALFAIPFLPFLLTGMGCAIYSGFKLFEDLTKKGTEDDVYVFGKGGFATLNRGKVKSWTPSKGMTLLPDMCLFSQSSSGPCWSSMKQQSVLMVRQNPLYSASVSAKCYENPIAQKFKSGRYQQVWFVGERDLMRLPGLVQTTLIESGGVPPGGMGGMGMTGFGGLMNGMGGLPTGMSIPVAQPCQPVDKRQSETPALSAEQLYFSMSAEQRAQMATYLQEQSANYVNQFTRQSKFQ